MATSKYRGRMVCVAPTQSTDIPPSDLCQAEGKPAAKAHRKAKANSRTCDSGGPPTTWTESAT
eukprot:2149410-Lingulodinium_polyedra.AAC.1